MIEHNAYRTLNKERTAVWENGLRKLPLWRRLGAFFSELLILRYLRQGLFVMLLGIIYVGNRHYASQLVQRVEQQKVRVQNVRTEYMEWEMKYIRVTRRSHLTQRVAALGLEESKVPPQVIRVGVD